MNQTETKIVQNLELFGESTLLEEIAKEQKRVIAAVRNTGKVGKVFIVLSFARKGANDVVVSSKVTPSIPKLALESTVLYADESNELHEGNPHQMKLSDNVVDIGKEKKVNEVK